MKKRIVELEQAAPQTAAEVQRLTDGQACTHVDISFETGPAARQAYGALTRAFDNFAAAPRSGTSPLIG